VARGFHPHLPLGEAAAGATNIKHVFDSRYRPTACQLVRKASMRQGSRWWLSVYWRSWLPDFRSEIVARRQLIGLDVAP
jgi:hypothetical protein